MKEKEFSSVEKYVIINNDRDFNVRYCCNYIITELKLNDNLFPKAKELVDEEEEEGYCVDDWW